MKDYDGPVPYAIGKAKPPATSTRTADPDRAERTKDTQTGDDSMVRDRVDLVLNARREQNMVAHVNARARGHPGSVRAAT